VESAIPDSRFPIRDSTPVLGLRSLWAILLLLLLAPATARATLLNDSTNPVQFRMGTELGLLQVMNNKLQFGKEGTMVDLVGQGGESNLYPFARLSAEMSINHRHTIIFLIQPLDLQTTNILNETIDVYSQPFPKGTPMNFHYGFDFFRISYLYNFMKDPEKELSIGASLQMRDASISFASLDGLLFRQDQNVGPVPALKARFEWPLSGQSWIGAEVDGIYASSTILNGSTNRTNFEGSLYDASVRYGLNLNQSLKAFINLRFLGGNAKGQGYVNPPNDGYTNNSLSTMSLTLGFYLK
jgi:hypothetical protein